MNKFEAGDMVKFMIGKVCVATGRIHGYRNVNFQPNTPVPTYHIQLLDGGDLWIPEEEINKDSMSLTIKSVG